MKQKIATVRMVPGGIECTETYVDMGPRIVRNPLTGKPVKYRKQRAGDAGAHTGGEPVISARQQLTLEQRIDQLFRKGEGK